MFELDARKMLSESAAATSAIGSQEPRQRDTQTIVSGCIGGGIGRNTVGLFADCGRRYRANHREHVDRACRRARSTPFMSFRPKASAGPTSRRLRLISGLSIVAFQAVDIYHVHAFRQPLHQMARMMAAWSGRLPVCRHAVLLLQVRPDVFAHLAARLLENWHRRPGRIALRCLCARAPLDARRTA